VDKDGNPNTSVTTAAGGSEKEFIALVGSKIDHVNRIILEYYLYEKNTDGTATLIETNTTNAGLIGCKDTAYGSLPVINTLGKIVVTSDYLVSSNTVTKVSAYKPDTLENLQKGITTPVDKLYYRNGANVVLNDDGTISAEMASGQVGTTTVAKNFVATKAEYDVGTFVRVDFKGENFPGRIIFGVTNMEDVLTSGAAANGYGFDISWNNAYVSDYNKGTSTWRVDSNTSTGNALYFNNSYFYRTDKNAGATTVKEIETGGSTTDFILIAGSTKDSANRAILEYRLYKDNADGTVTLLETNKMNAGIIGTDFNAKGSIMITGDYVRVAASHVSKVTVHTPDTLENLKKNI
jgi:hypothetical protein